MFQDEFQAVCTAGKNKLNLLEKNPLGYFVAAMLAGLFVAFGSFVCFTLGTPFKAAESPATKLVMGFSFTAALSLVIAAGAELFTGNVFVLTSASLSKAVTWGKTIKVWVVSYLGNLIGTLIGVALFQLSGVPSGDVGAHFAAASATKMALPPVTMITRGILCNILVCLAVWCSIKMKSESGKLIITFWCIFVFIVCGFEHSIANMGILAVGLLNAGDAAVSISGYFYNLVLVTLANLIGGAVFLALPYYLISKKKEN